MGELREAYAMSWSPEAHGPKPLPLWANRAEDTPAVRCLMRRHDGAVTEGEQPVKLPRIGQSGR